MPVIARFARCTFAITFICVIAVGGFLAPMATGTAAASGGADPVNGVSTSAKDASATTAAPRDVDSGAPAEFVSDYAARHGLPGAAYVVVRDGRVITGGATGDVTAQTPMSIGSVAKSFTAFAVLQLVDRGDVDLDDPITDYLPGFSIRSADPSAITVRMLLSHTSGLPNPLITEPTGSLRDDVADIADLDADAQPGTTYGYSNLNYRTLARLVEVESGQGFDTYLHDEVFAPLGMEDTTSVISVDGQVGLDSGQVTAYGTALPLPELATDIGGSGGVISTAEDMGAWLAMQQRGGTASDGTRLLSRKLVDESHAKQPNAGTYALGWQHTSTADPARIGHDGALTRYSAREDLVPSTGYAVAVLLDSYTPTYDHPFAISTGLIDIADGADPELGLPVATIIDLVLGAITVLVLVLGVQGLRRSRSWARRRAEHPWWRRILRLLPQAIMPAMAIGLFVGLTLGRGNPATPLDVLGLWPALMIGIAVAGIVGVVVIAARVRVFVGLGKGLVGPVSRGRGGG